MINFNLPTKIGNIDTVVRTSDTFCNLTELFKQYNETNGTDKLIENFKRQEWMPEYLEGVCEYLNSRKLANKNEDSNSVESTDLKPKDIMISARGKYGASWAHPLVAVEAAAYLSPKLKVAANVAFLEAIERSKNRKTAAQRTKEINSMIGGLFSKDTNNLYAFKEIIKLTNRLINTMAFGEHYDGIRDSRNSLDDLDALDKAFDTVQGFITESNTVDDYVAKCKSVVANAS